MKLTADHRILMALRDGFTFTRAVGSAYGTGHNFETCLIRHPDGRRLSIRSPSAWRARDAGLIEQGRARRSDDYEVQQEHEWTLTEAGQAAAALLPQVPADVLFAPPEPAAPEKLDRARARRHMAKVVKVLTFNGGRIRGRRVMFPGTGSCLTVPYASNLRRDIPDDVMALLAPHVGPFVDVDGKESLRITEPGIAATAKRVR
ncbi:hypothetical protein V1294_006045 [Bradyrhizobium sp. AZCC 1678]|uniref:hypothetical protein n=1 Tax=Bradyrhizobium sp. AZCC 1678 TaxID=3117030 RepID=UPI002FF2D335